VIKLYISCDEYVLTGLRDAVLWRLKKALDSLIKNKKGPAFAFFPLVYDNTPEGPPLRTFISRYIGCFCFSNAAPISSGYIKKMQNVPGFAVDMANVIFRAGMENYKNPRSWPVVGQSTSQSSGT
jgi:hypothetical protein